MAKARIYEIAKELDIDSKLIIEKLKEMNIDVKNHMSSISDDVTDKIKASLGKKTEQAVTKNEGAVSAAQVKRPEENGKAKQSGAKPKQTGAEQAKAAGNGAKEHRTSQPAQDKKPHEQGQRRDQKNDNSAQGQQRPQGQNRNQTGGQQRPSTQGKQQQPVQKGQQQRTNQNANNKNRPPQNNQPGEQKGSALAVAEEQYQSWSGSGNTKPEQIPRSAKRPESGGFKSKFDKNGRNNKNYKGKGKGGRRSTEPPREFAEVKHHVVLEDFIKVQELAHQLGKKATDVIMKLMAMGVMATINQDLDVDTATIIAEEFGATVEVKISKEEELFTDIEDKPEELKHRPPVVTIMGHVDHGKTSLLDKIRSASVTTTEAGGITQHIGAYQVEANGQKITFLDTPGHEAFTAMRARGAQVTDIAILVVAADDGVMPQTIEAIDHAKAAEVPIIIAINKIDKPEANADRIKQELTNYGLVPEEWGGETIMVPVSAKSGQGIDELLEMILLVAEVADLKANPNRNAKGKVVESKLDKGRGPVATLLIQAGTLHIGDFLIVGTTQGRIRAMFDFKGRSMKTALPSMPVEILGLNEVPAAGDDFIAVDNEKLAKQVADKRQQDKHQMEIARNTKVTLEDIFAQIKDGEVKELNIILKADVQGSIEAIRQSLEKLGNSEVRVNIIRTAVGGIREADVMLAAASNAIIIGFNVRPDINAKRLAEKETVEVKTYRVIYEAIDDVKAALSGLLTPDIKEVDLGQAEVRTTFKVPKVGTVAGCYVTEGKITRHAKIRVLRDSVVIHDGELASLKRFKDDVKEVATGYECGIGMVGFNDIKEGDVLEAYTFEEIQRKL